MKVHVRTCELNKYVLNQDFLPLFSWLVGSWLNLYVSGLEKHEWSGECLCTFVRPPNWNIFNIFLYKGIVYVSH